VNDGTIIFDGVVHAIDYSLDAAKEGHEEAVALVRDQVGGFAALTAENGPAINPDFQHPPEHDYAHQVLFENSDTDFAMAQTVPLLVSWKGGLGPAQLNYELAQSKPDRIFFCGGVDPLVMGLEAALEEMERQVEEWGAISFKFYQAQGARQVWRADDEKIAYPLWQKAEELGVKLVQFHKGFPLGKQPVEHLKPNDLQLAAGDFPNLNFGVHHFGDPYVDELLNIAGRYENIYLIMPVWFNQYFLQPQEMLHRLGKTLLFVGNDRLCYGSEAFTWPSVQQYIEMFQNLEMPEDLREGYGYPEITAETRRNVLGLNMARALGIDIESRARELGITNR